mmetsp:Transcript_28254/g.60908  ORF Transcript_28254/g.60908 Transcript_28254/m.60908 type:complete len:438 (-) Transcript_28254:202-1515(-)
MRLMMVSHLAVLMIICSIAIEAFRPLQGSANVFTCGQRTRLFQKRDYGFGSSNRRKVGPPQRKLNQEVAEEETVPGRVSVFSVGATIDLTALRAHVFRRGFGNKDVPSTGTAGDTTPELVLSRRAESSAFDDEVLHVTNAPFSISSDPLSLLNNLADDEADALSDPGSLPPKSARDRAYEQLSVLTQDTFYFEYGCVVFWGLAEEQERSALAELAPFVREASTSEELEKSYDYMTFKFDRNSNPNRPVRFDRVIIRTLRMEEKLALSYAMSQSSKLFVFEYKVLQSLEKTRFLPKELAMKGEIKYNKKRLNKIIGQLFVEQTEVNLFSSILDSPDFLWDDDEFVPSYQYTRSYLEVDARVALLNSRLAVIRELLDVLTAQVADSNSTRLEWIVVWLIAVELVIGIAKNPLFAGKRLISALIVPTAIILYKKIDWTEL